MNIIASNRPFPSRDVKSPEELNKLLWEENPEHIFFPYWSWKVSDDVIRNHRCIGFHTGDTAGGSPIQNLIRSGVENTTVKMFFMTDKIDEGYTILTHDISLLGSLEEIIMRQTDIMKDMIDAYLQTHQG